MFNAGMGCLRLLPHYDLKPPPQLADAGGEENLPDKLDRPPGAPRHRCDAEDRERGGRDGDDHEDHQHDEQNGGVSVHGGTSYRRRADRHATFGAAAGAGTQVVAARRAEAFFLAASGDSVPASSHREP